MGNTYQDRFVVYVQDDGLEGPTSESEIAQCDTYEEAKKIRHEVGGRPHQCVIRYIGPSGGGD